MALASAAGLHLLGFSPWAAQPHASLTDFVAVVTIVGLCACVEAPRVAVDPAGTLRASFVADMAALMVFGPMAMTLVALISGIASLAVESPRAVGMRRAVLSLVSIGLATQAAGLAYAVLGGTAPPLAWPWAAIPVAGAVIAWCALASAVADVVGPITAGSPVQHAWPRHALRGGPAHVTAASAAAGLVELAGHEAWTLAPVVAVPLFFAWNAYITHAGHTARRQRRVQAPATLDHGVCVLDEQGRVHQWNETLAAWLECDHARAVGRVLADAVPALAATPLPQAVREALSSGTTHTIAHVPFRSAATSRILTVTLVPDPDGLTLVWRDVTDSLRAEQALRDVAERFALVAQGGNDGIWELDDSTRSLFVSGRWRELVGLPPGDTCVARNEWFSRVHPDDDAVVQRALATIGAGGVDRIELEHRIRHENGSYRRVLCRALAARGASGRVRVAGTLTDITDSALAQEKILNAGSRDPLTGLLNRAAFVERLGQRLEAFAQRRAGRFAVLYLDLDRFKVVNDSLGHLIGDDLLIAVSRRLETCLRPGDAIARLGGDEFAVLLQAISDETQANVVAFRLQEALQAPFPAGGREVVTSASIGIAISRPEYTNPEEMMRDADTAMYHAKSHGKARHELFDADMHARALDRLGFETDLRHAVKISGFEVHYQPIVSLTTRRCTGFESLVRWNRNGKPVSPADFIPMAEELGIIEPLGTWVMQQACQKFVEWKQRFPQAELDCITVNVSARQLVQQGFIYLVEQTVEQNRMNPADLRLEITETALMDAPQFAAKVLAELREYGVKIYLDDFGTGYSSLSHLHKLPVDALKIDRSFVRGLLVTDRPAIVESILALARTLQTNVVAEGIEEELQALELERLGCRQAQGFYFSRPIPAAQIEDMLRAGQPLGGPRAPHPRPAWVSSVTNARREIA